jgi:hypothetical protein
VRRGHHQHAALAAAGGEAIPRELGVVGRVRPAIHPDGAIVAAVDAVDRVADEAARRRVDELGDAHVRTRAAHDVLRRVRDGLLRRQ